MELPTLAGRCILESMEENGLLLNGNVSAEIPLMLQPANVPPRWTRVKHSVESLAVDCRELVRLGLIEPYNDVAVPEDARVFRISASGIALIRQSR